MRALDRQDGLTLIETLVTLTLLGIVTIGFYSVLFSGSRGTKTAGDVAAISQEARLGLNRMVRDTREAGEIEGATATSYTVKVDFNRDQDYDASPSPPAAPDAEVLTFEYVSSDKTIRLNNEILMSGVTPISGQDIFTYTSNRLEYDWDNNGTTTVAELDAAGPSHGVTLLTNKLLYVSSVEYAFRVSSGSRATDFYAQAQLRNRRSSI